ncbi:uncharacterized protein HMPREF1541_00517 [Cyphellophora europaea CBS 101466]|uniref:Extracellular membrane protein CFEM domain-containing protein n=1 Tax=Cyphellophora europaea (strain CBS 101466) TaxID=1220924 RepID=W2SE64_CYPE1|nr:uncharacterized protein HMPREF1541_00517 [Cyphellophora europaea CBS 101466]ETN46333.1 hypothetical protein HMPREF1541_00517 [Cyphellophora europaea CBS 101466]
MKYTGVIAAFAAVAAAQSVTSTGSSSTPTGSSSSCDAQNILDACKATIQGQINTCKANDYSCLCENYGNLLTCYNNCPNDIGVGTVQQQRDQNCNAASVYGTTTSYGTASSTASSASATGSDSETAAHSGFASATESDGAQSTNSDSGAAALQIGANLLFAAGTAAYLFL